MGSCPEAPGDSRPDAARASGPTYEPAVCSANCERADTSSSARLPLGGDERPAVLFLHMQGDGHSCSIASHLDRATILATVGILTFALPLVRLNGISLLAPFGSLLLIGSACYLFPLVPPGWSRRATAALAIATGFARVASMFVLLTDASTLLFGLALVVGVHFFLLAMSLLSPTIGGARPRMLWRVTLGAFIAFDVTVGLVRVLMSLLAGTDVFDAGGMTNSGRRPLILVIAVA
jgi:hypothetical protein